MAHNNSLTYAMYAVADALYLPFLFPGDNKLAVVGNVTHKLCALDVIVPFKMIVRHSIIKKDFVLLQINGPGSLFFLVYSEVNSKQGIPHIHVLVCDKAKLSPTTEFPASNQSITPEKLKVIYGPSVVKHVYRARGAKEWLK